MRNIGGRSYTGYTLDMKKAFWILGGIIVVWLVVGVVAAFMPRHTVQPGEGCGTHPWPCGMQATGNDKAFVSYPYPAGQAITSPVEIGGAIRLPYIGKEGIRATVVDWDGRSIGESVLTKQPEAEWATTTNIPSYDPSQRLVYYRGSVSFVPPDCRKDQDFCHRGWIIFGKQYELPVTFK